MVVALSCRTSGLVCHVQGFVWCKGLHVGGMRRALPEHLGLSGMTDPLLVLSVIMPLGAGPFSCLGRRGAGKADRGDRGGRASGAVCVVWVAPGQVPESRVGAPGRVHAGHKARHVSHCSRGLERGI